MPDSVLSADDRLHLERAAGSHVAFNEPMSRRTTLKIGGPVDALVAPASVDELREVVRVCHQRKLPVVAIGGGSNLLVLDGGIRGVAIATRNLRGLERSEATVVSIEAGVSTGKLLSMATKWGLGGLEFLGGVPGSLGGGLIMNAGTYLGEFKDVTTEVTSVRLANGSLVNRDNATCGFEYRRSALPADEIVVAATLELLRRPRAEIEKTVRELRERRDEREPKKVSNAGSTFKNPSGDYAGRLIETAGLKGTRVGAAECSPVHANWLVNTGGATAAQLLELIELVRGKVRDAHGVELALELKIIGEP